MDSKLWKRIGIGTAYFLLIVCALVSLLPLYWVFTTAMQLPAEVMTNPPKVVPTVVKEFFPLWFSGQRDAAIKMFNDSFSNFNYLFTKTDIVRWFFNSVIVAVSATAGVVLFDTMAGYVLAKKKFPGRDFIFWCFISTMMIPGQVTLVPMFIMTNSLGLKSSLWAVILPPLSMVFGVFLMRQFMQTIPGELMEAAKIDGATEWGTYWRVVLPLAKPAVATLAILTFMSVWNSFLWPLIVLNEDSLYTLPVGLKMLQDRNLVNYGLLMSGAAISSIPMMIVFLSFQKYFVKGLTLGGLKG